MSELEPTPLTAREAESASSTPGSPTGSAHSGATDPGPVMITYAHTSNPGLSEEAWKDQVLAFALALREVGVDADLDQLNPDADWNRYGPLAIQHSAVTLAVVNAAWRARYEGTNVPTEGAGAAAEAAVLQALFAEDQDAFRRRVKVVVLPGATTHDIPLVLRGPTYFKVEEFTPAGLDELLRTLTDQPAHLRPPRGTLPVLPPQTVAGIKRQVAAAAAASIELRASGAQAQSGSSARASIELRASSGGLSTSTGGTAHRQPEAGSATPVSAQELARLREAAALVEAAGRQTTPPSPARRDERRQLQELSEQVSAVQAQLEHLNAALSATGENASSPTPTAGAPALSSQEVDQQVAALLEQVEAGLKLTDQCWLVLAAVLDPPRASRGAGQQPRVVRERLARAVADWVGSTSPPVPVTNPDTTSRDGRRVVFPGTAPTVEESASTSQMWRLEVDPTSGAAVAAGVVSGQVQLQGVTGTGFPSPLQVGERALVLPVRLEMLELWLLCQMQMLAVVLSNADDGSACAGAACAAVHLRATLLSPPDLTHPDVEAAVDRPQGQWLRPVAERRNEDENAIDEVAVVGSRQKATGSAIATDVLATTLARLQEPISLVATARDLALDLIGHFGVENTIVLRPPPYAQTASEGGELPVDALRAPQAWQQLTHQHARALDLPVDAEEDSPAQRRTRYTEAVDEARRTILRRGSRP